MTIRKKLFPISCLAVFAASSVAPLSRQDSPRVLVFSKTLGYRHASIEAGVESIRRLGGEHGFVVTSTEDAGVFDTPVLSGYDVVIFLCTTGDVLNEGQQDALMHFVRSGGGYVGVHSATDTEYDWPWYGALVGAYFAGHPNDPNVREATVIVGDAWRDSGPQLPVPWIRTDEWYDFRDFNGNVEVLLNIDETSYKRPDESPRPTPRPIAWRHVFDGGRAFYTAMGHTEESYSEPLFVEHLWRGIEFVMGRDP